MNDVLLQWGALGVSVMGLGVAVRVLFAQVSANAKAERDRADRNEAALRAQTDALVERIVPALAQNTQAMTQFIALTTTQGRGETR